MSIAYDRVPPRKVRFEWIGESWSVFAAQAGSWVLATFVYGFILMIVMYAIELAVMFPMFIKMMGPAMVSPGTPPPNPYTIMRPMLPMMYLTGALMAIVAMALNAYLGGGLLQMANKAVRGYPVGVGDLFSAKSTFGALFVYQLILYVPVLLVSLLATYPLMERAYSSAATTLDPFAQMRAMMPIYGVSFAIDLIPIVLLALFWPGAAMIADGDSARNALDKSWNAMKGSWLISAVFMLVLGILVMISSIPCGLGLLATIPMAVIISSLMYRDMAGMPNSEPPVAPYYPTPPPAPGVWPSPPQNPGQ